MIYKELIKTEKISVDKEELYRLLGYPENKIPMNIVADVDELMPKALNKMKIQAGYYSFQGDQIQIQDSMFMIDGIEFNCGKIVARHLQNCEKLYIFAATLGNDYDDFYNRYFDEGDPYFGYLLNTIGSAAIEGVVEYLSSIIREDSRNDGLKTTNRFSPGYCQWNVNEQHKLFSLLPKGFLEIKLNDSTLMKPIKSVSGVVGGGKSVEKLEYACHLCDRHDCIMRRKKRKENKNGS